MIIPEAIEAYTEWGAEVLSPSTITGYGRALASFWRWVEDKYPQVTLVADIDPRLHVTAWRDWRRGQGIADSTINTELCAVSQWLRFCGDRRWILAEIAAVKVDRPTVTHPRPTILSIQEVRNRIAAQPDQFRKTVLTVLAATGLRQGELRSLPHDAYDQDLSTIHV